VDPELKYVVRTVDGELFKLRFIGFYNITWVKRISNYRISKIDDDKNSYTALLTALVYTLFAVASLAQGVDELRLKQMLGFLASDELEGRKPGTPGDIATANYILEQFKKAGLNVDPPFGLQSFDVVIDAAPGDKKPPCSE
jgi:hypothetical protein